MGGDPEVGKSFDTLPYMAEKAIESNRARKQKYNEVSKAELASLVAQW